MNSTNYNKLIIIVGPSASGKTEIVNYLINNYGYIKCITTTTRPIRKNEKNNIDYNFVLKEEFKYLINNDKFIEYTMYQNEFYGLEKKSLENGNIIILEPSGAKIVKEIYKDNAIVFYINSPFQLRHERLLKREKNIEKILKREEADSKLFIKSNLNFINYTIYNNYDSKISDLAQKINYLLNK